MQRSNMIFNIQTFFFNVHNYKQTSVLGNNERILSSITDAVIIIINVVLYNSHLPQVSNVMTFAKFPRYSVAAVSARRLACSSHA